MTIGLMLIVGLGGACGGSLRFLMGEWLSPPHWATWLANVTGSVAMGFFWVILPESAEGWRAFVLSGFCGALTTFSSWVGQTEDLRCRLGKGVALAYVCVTVAACLAGFVSGSWLAGLL